MAVLVPRFMLHMSCLKVLKSLLAGGLRLDQCYMETSCFVQVNGFFFPSLAEHEERHLVTKIGSNWLPDVGLKHVRIFQVPPHFRFVGSKKLPVT